MRGKAFGPVASPVVTLGRPAAGGLLKTISTTSVNAAGSQSVTVPTGATQCLGYARGSGGGGAYNSSAPGGGGAEESVTFTVAPGSTVSITVGAAGARGNSTTLAGFDGAASTISYGGQALCTADFGRGGVGTMPGAGGTSTAAGSPGQPGASGRGGISGSLKPPFAGTGGQGNGGSGTNGGGGAANGTVSPGDGGPGVVSLIFMGP